MLITFTDYGAVAKLVITSSLLTLRKHNRVVDAVLFNVPGIIENRSGFSGLNHLCQEKHATFCAPTKLHQGSLNDEKRRSESTA